MPGQRAKQADEEVQTEGDAAEVMDVSANDPRRIPSKKWCELIKKVWEADPLRCPKCSGEMRIVSLIDEEDVIERILRHLGLWQEGERVHCGTDPSGETTLDPWLDDRLPRLRHRTGHGVLRHLKRPAAPERASRTPCSAVPSAPAAAFSGCGRAPQPEKARV